MIIVHVPVLVRIHKGIIDLNVQNNMYIGLWVFFTCTIFVIFVQYIHVHVIVFNGR